MAKKIFMSKMILVVVLLAIVLYVIVNPNYKEGYVVIAGTPATRARTAARIDARTYTGPGDAYRGPVAPAKRARRTVIWYNPFTWF